MFKKKKSQLNASTFFLLSSFLSIFLFSKNIAVVVLLFLVFGDMIASFIGTNFGKIKIFNKTLEGSIACFLVCFFISYVFFNFKISFAGAVTATFTELFSFRINDNLLIPIISGIVIILIL